MDINIVNYDGENLIIEVNSVQEKLKVDGVEGFLTGVSDTFWIKIDDEFIYRGDQYREHGHGSRTTYETTYAIDKLQIEELTNKTRSWQNVIAPTSGQITEQRNQVPGEILWSRNSPLTVEK